MCRSMALIRSIFWVALFIVATFCFVVLFEYGPEGFVEGVPVELEKIKELALPAESKGDVSDTLPH